MIILVREKAFSLLHTIKLVTCLYMKGFSIFILNSSTLLHKVSSLYTVVQLDAFLSVGKNFARIMNIIILLPIGLVGT